MEKVNQLLMAIFHSYVSLPKGNMAPKRESAKQICLARRGKYDAGVVAYHLIHTMAAPQCFLHGTRLLFRLRN